MIKRGGSKLQNSFKGNCPQLQLSRCKRLLSKPFRFLLQRNRYLLIEGRKGTELNEKAIWSACFFIGAGV